MTQKTALFPGSFDPFTSGHAAIVQRALALFDHIVVAVGVNTDKKYMFTSQQRMQKIRDSFPNDSRVEVVEYSDMTVDLCKRVGAHFILRGIRNAKDEMIGIINSAAISTPADADPTRLASNIFATVTQGELPTASALEFVKQEMRDL